MIEESRPTSIEAKDYESVYQSALQIIRQSWLDAGMTPEEYAAEEKRSEAFREKVEIRWAKGESIDDLLLPNSELLVRSVKV